MLIFPVKNCAVSSKKMPLSSLSLRSQLLSGRSGFTFNTNRNSKIYRVFSDIEKEGERTRRVYTARKVVKERRLATMKMGGERHRKRKTLNYSSIHSTSMLAYSYYTTYKLGAGNNTGQGNVFLASLGKNLLSGNETA